jgi:hypothetical protein
MAAPRTLPLWQADLDRYRTICEHLQAGPAPRPPAALETGGCLLSGRPWLNPRHVIAEFEWPVQRIGPRFRRKQADGLPVRLLVFRTVVGGVDTLPGCDASVALVDSLARRRVSGRRQLADLACSLHDSRSVPDAMIPSNEQGLQRGLLQLLETFRARGLVLGSLPLLSDVARRQRLAEPTASADNPPP